MCIKNELIAICDGTLTYRELSDRLDRSKSYIEELVRDMKLPKPRRDLSNTRKSSAENQVKIEHIKRLANGFLTSEEIALSIGCSHKYAQNILLKYDLPRLPQSPRKGSKNQSWVGGRAIDLDGYVLVRAPENHPYCRKTGTILEHRLVMEHSLGRYLTRDEVVDHIDSITIHNSPQNLRLFSSNSDHLKATISGQIPDWSKEGKNKLIAARNQHKGLPIVDTYRRRKERGDVRLRTILLAWLSLEKDSPFLLGTRHWLEQAGISDLSYSSLIRHLSELNQRYT